MQEDTTREKVLLGWFGAGFILVLATKLYLASILDLYSDEIFYWWASTRLSLAYSDLPFMTALMAGLGAGFEPASPIQVRSLFLVLGSSLPLLVYWIAIPIYGRRMAIESAALTLCLPLGGFMGLLAVPDVPLVFFGLLAIGSFERALRIDHWAYWLATGLWVAMGLCTHYRFFLYPLAAVLFLAIFPPVRSQWRNTHFWSAVGIACFGLIPILWFNLSNQLSSASFYLVERHPWEFQPAGLLHVLKQAGLVTPPLYVLFLLTIWQLYKQGRNHDQSAALLLSFALTNLLVYLVLAPWTDANSTSIHWPLSGYFPLLVAVPATLRMLSSQLAQKYGGRVATKAVLTIPAIGFAGTLVAFIGIGSQAFQEPLQGIVGTGVLSNKMAGWRAFALQTDENLATQFTDTNPLVITDNYYTAAQVEFAGLSKDTLTLDQDKAVRDGRITQLQLWNKSLQGLNRYKGDPALFITEDSTLEIDDKTALMGMACDFSSEVTWLGELNLFNGDKAFNFYYLPSLIDPSGETDTRAFPCPFPIHAWLDQPAEGDELSGVSSVAGWAYSEDIGVDGIDLLINGETFARAEYGLNREDVVTVRNIETDPNAPALGFGLQLDTSLLANGYHELAIRVSNRQGSQTVYGRRRVRVAN